MNIDFKSKKTAFIIFVIIGIIYTAPLISNLGSIVEGAYNIDWDYNLNVNHVARESIIEYGQFPLWNSYSCGGNVLFSNPYSSFLYPGFIFVLIFKEIVGLKILMTVQIIIGMYGMFLLSKHYKFEKYSAY
ncbi:hypothetical protein H8D36_02705, partial [archaeon]|nr:hypothetical protein [archaeon]